MQQVQRVHTGGCAQVRVHTWCLCVGTQAMHVGDGLCKGSWTRVGVLGLVNAGGRAWHSTLHAPPSLLPSCMNEILIPHLLTLAQVRQR
jgi:hypothetical protein